MDYVTIPELTELADGSIVGTDEMIVYDTSAITTKSAKISSLLTYMSANISSGSTDVIEDITHYSDGSISVTTPISLVYLAANVTLPAAATATHILILNNADTTAKTITCASSNYIQDGNSNITSISIPAYYCIVLISIQSALWIPVSKFDTSTIA